jgi:hypothetical protein
MTRFFRIFSALALVIGWSQNSSAGQGATALDSAKSVFDRYVALEKAFDAAVADLYADDAIITNRRTYPTGEARQIQLPARQYKELIRQAMPLAKQQNDTNRYSECAYKPNGSRVEILCKRFSERKKYTSPLRLVVGPGSGGSWVIQEEHSESIP